MKSRAFNGDVRVVMIDGAPWWAAADVHHIVGVSKAGTNFSFLGDDEKQVIRKCGQTSLKGHGLLFISESGLYKFVLRSDKPEARAFQDWVTRVVLPAIRKDGAYIMGEEKVATGEVSALERRADLGCT